MVLPRQGIDIILGMNWLRTYGVVLNLRQRIVELKLPSSKDRMSLLMPSVPTLLVVAYGEASPDLSSIPVVCEFLDVFPKIYLGYHRIGRLSLQLSWNLVLLLFHSVLTSWLQRKWQK